MERGEGLKLYPDPVGACLWSERGWLWPKIRGAGILEPGHFAMVMLGTPTRGTSLTVIWNKRYSI